ncbi:hypothetical protein [Lignipirellula cremea]|uniref:Uncharacterized protein n=1 Tax=Lignipirellula cremea TaxID=2528010 RepID=A0A518DYS3_9BACT|nr:hypothetical protein [Lignipirellula cremea]QDU96988.1 hypothetical protein Pla8534_48130 [Lignipirellula cremea]
MNDAPSGPEHPAEILGRRVLGVCPVCEGEGLLWDCDDETHWADRCEHCNCLGYLLDLRLPKEPPSDQEEIPF